MANVVLIERDTGASTRPVVPDDMVRIDGGTFRMGSDVDYPEERPAHAVTADLLPALSAGGAISQAVDTTTSHIGFRCVLRPI